MLTIALAWIFRFWPLSCSQSKQSGQNADERPQRGDSHEYFVKIDAFHLSSPLPEPHCANGSGSGDEPARILIWINPNIAPESGIFPERFLPRLFERTKADVIHRLAGRSGKLGEKIPGKTG
ncbi:hypothetical protein, partial [Thiolapillus sp.]